MDSQPTFYTLYRQTGIGLALADSIDELVAAKKITSQLANSIMLQFDKIMAQNLAENVKTHLTMKGKVNTYRFCDEVWTFVLEDVLLKFTEPRKYTEEMKVTGKVRVVACSSHRQPPE